jgi:hypothetical protein
LAQVRVFDTILEQSQSETDRLWIQVVVEKRLQGDIENDTMSVLASSGTSCDPGYDFFSIGQRLVINIWDETTGGPTPFYSFAFNNGCSEQFLVLDGDMVSGNIKDKYESQPYHDFKNNLGTCANFTHTFERGELERFINIFPVPASSVATIYNQIGFDYDYTLLTATGQVVLWEQVIGEYDHPLPVSGLPNGLYFLHFQVGEVPFVKRLVVQH